MQPVHWLQRVFCTTLSVPDYHARTRDPSAEAASPHEVLPRRGRQGSLSEEKEAQMDSSGIQSHSIAPSRQQRLGARAPPQLINLLSTDKKEF